MRILCLDLEGVLIPEVWVNVAERSGILELKRTTRDEPNYDTLMRWRLNLLRQHGLTLKRIQDVISTLSPLSGALDFLNWAREHFQVAIISDTFYEFGLPFMRQLGYPTLLCHRLSVDSQGMISDYHLRQKDPKRHSVRAFKSLHYQVIAAGDSYNDVSMLEEADRGILVHPPAKVRAEFPQYPVVESYQAFQAELLRISQELDAKGP